MKWTRLLQSNFELDADLRKDLLEKTNNEQRVNTILQLLPDSMKTRNYAYWLLKLDLTFPKDSNTVKKFLSMLSEGAIKDRDINHYSCVEDLETAIENNIQEKNDKSNKKVEDRIVPGSEIVYNNGQYQVVKVETYPAAQSVCNTSKYNKSSPWCISYSKNYFYQYEPPYYVVFKNGNPYAVITNDRIWDNKDNDDNEHVYMELEPIVEKLHINNNYDNIIEMESPMFMTPQFATMEK